MASHTRKISHKCARCGDTFSHSSVLWEHMQIHLGKYHKCLVCDKVLTSRNKLTRHMKTHTEYDIIHDNVEVNGQMATKSPNVLKSNEVKGQMTAKSPNVLKNDIEEVKGEAAAKTPNVFKNIEEVKGDMAAKSPSILKSNKEVEREMPSKTPNVLKNNEEVKGQMAAKTPKVLKNNEEVKGRMAANTPNVLKDDEVKAQMAAKSPNVLKNNEVKDELAAKTPKVLDKNEEVKRQMAAKSPNVLKNNDDVKDEMATKTPSVLKDDEKVKGQMAAKSQIVLKNIEEMKSQMAAKTPKVFKNTNVLDAVKQHSVNMYREVMDNLVENLCRDSENGSSSINTSYSVHGEGIIGRKKSKRSARGQTTACDRDTEKTPSIKRECEDFVSENQPNDVTMDEWDMPSAIKSSKKENCCKCSECSEGFVLKVDLDEHMLGHIDIKPQRCHHCGILFSTPSILNAHIAVAHSADTLWQSPCKEHYPVLRETSNHMIEDYPNPTGQFDPTRSEFPVALDIDHLHNRNFCGNSFGMKLPISLPNSGHSPKEYLSPSPLQRHVKIEGKDKRHEDNGVHSQCLSTVNSVKDQRRKRSINGAIKRQSFEKQCNTSGRRDNMGSVGGGQSNFVIGKACSEPDKDIDLQNVLSHIGKTPQKCCHCGVLFSTPSMLNAHIAFLRSKDSLLDSSHGKKYPVLTGTLNQITEGSAKHSECNDLVGTHGDFLMAPAGNWHKENDISKSPTGILQKGVADTRHVLKEHTSPSQFQLDVELEEKSKMDKLTHQAEKLQQKSQKGNGYGRNAENAKLLENSLEENEGKMILTGKQCRKCSSLVCQTELPPSSSPDFAIGDYKMSHKCSRCGILFSHLSEEPSDTNKNPHKCLQCVEEFPTVSELNSHMVTHLDNCIFSSQPNTNLPSEQEQITNKGMDNCRPSSRKKRKRQTGKRLHKCLKCGKLLSSTSSLQGHMHIHTGYAPYKCSSCNQRFKYSSDLRKHKVSHTGYMPYMCYFCGKEYVEKYRLKQHMMSHTGERPFECLHCGQAFSRLSNLNRHIMKGHKGEVLDHSTFIAVYGGTEVHLCTICGKGYRWSSGLANHMKGHIAGEPSEVIVIDDDSTMSVSLCDDKVPGDDKVSDDKYPVMRDSLNSATPKEDLKYSDGGLTDIVVKTELATVTSSELSDKGLTSNVGSEHVTSAAGKLADIGIADTCTNTDYVAHSASKLSIVNLTDTGLKTEYETYTVSMLSHVDVTNANAIDDTDSHSETAYAGKPPSVGLVDNQTKIECMIYKADEASSGIGDNAAETERLTSTAACKPPDVSFTDANAKSDLMANAGELSSVRLADTCPTTTEHANPTTSKGSDVDMTDNDAKNEHLAYAKDNLSDATVLKFLRIHGVWNRLP